MGKIVLSVWPADREKCNVQSIQSYILNEYGIIVDDEVVMNGFSTIEREGYLKYTNKLTLRSLVTITEKGRELSVLYKKLRESLKTRYKLVQTELSPKEKETVELEKILHYLKYYFFWGKEKRKGFRYSIYKKLTTSVDSVESLNKKLDQQMLTTIKRLVHVITKKKSAQAKKRIAANRRQATRI